MKKIKLLIVLIFGTALIFGTSSCVTLTPHQKGNKTHKGWNKNSNNPHHKNTTNPGHSKKKHK